MKFIISSVFVAAAPIAARSWQDSYEQSPGVNLPEQDLAGCSITGDIRENAESQMKCAGECLDNEACVALVFHPWGTMLKKTSSTKEERDGFYTWIMKEKVQECGIIYSKCGGKNEDGSAWAGPTCCRPDYQNHYPNQIKETHCVKQDEWYSQCVDEDQDTVTEFARATHPIHSTESAAPPAAVVV
jgi:hypothetical protein